MRRGFVSRELLFLFPRANPSQSCAFSKTTLFLFLSLRKAVSILLASVLLLSSFFFFAAKQWGRCSVEEAAAKEHVFTRGEGYRISELDTHKKDEPEATRHQQGTLKPRHGPHPSTYLRAGHDNKVSWCLIKDFLHIHTMTSPECRQGFSSSSSSFYLIPAAPEMVPGDTTGLMRYRRRRNAVAEWLRWHFNP